MNPIDWLLGTDWASSTDTQDPDAAQDRYVSMIEDMEKHGWTPTMNAKLDLWSDGIADGADTAQEVWGRILAGEAQAISDTGISPDSLPRYMKHRGAVAAWAGAADTYEATAEEFAPGAFAAGVLEGMADDVTDPKKPYIWYGLGGVALLLFLARR